MPETGRDGTLLVPLDCLKKQPPSTAFQAGVVMAAFLA
jgi:hypothetical protein